MAKAKRKFIAGKKYDGHKVISVTAGRENVWGSASVLIGFKCEKCGADSKVASGPVTQWLNKQMPWLCPACRDERHKVKQGAKRQAAVMAAMENAIGTALREVDGKIQVCATVKCEACSQPFEERARVIRVMESGAGVRCKTCRKQKKVGRNARVNASSSGTKVSAPVLKMWLGLTGAIQDAAWVIVRRHIEACYRHGFSPENLDRVFIEAAEQAKMDAKDAPPVVRSRYEPVWRFEQYIAPREA